LNNLMRLAADNSASSQVRALASLKLDQLKTFFDSTIPPNENQQAQNQYAAALIERFQKNPDSFQFAEPPAPPPGAPIGTIKNLDLPETVQIIK
ncbi:hypothetical protein ACFL02_09450, partial [Planctomycetota bacterium]